MKKTFMSNPPPFISLLDSAPTTVTIDIVLNNMFYKLYMKYFVPSSITTSSLLNKRL